MCIYIYIYLSLALFVSPSCLPSLFPLSPLLVHFHVPFRRFLFFSCCEQHAPRPSVTHTYHALTPKKFDLSNKLVATHRGLRDRSSTSDLSLYRWRIFFQLNIALMLRIVRCKFAKIHNCQDCFIDIYLAKIIKYSIPCPSISAYDYTFLKF